MRIRSGPPSLKLSVTQMQDQQRRRSKAKAETLPTEPLERQGGGTRALYFTADGRPLKSGESVAVTWNQMARIAADAFANAALDTLQENDDEEDAA
jgi:hypothetical protein